VLCHGVMRDDLWCDVLRSMWCGMCDALCDMYCDVMCGVVWCVVLRCDM
jgi:hypothetical protein